MSACNAKDLTKSKKEKRLKELTVQIQTKRRGLPTLNKPKTFARAFAQTISTPVRERLVVYRYASKFAKHVSRKESVTSLEDKDIEKPKKMLKPRSK